MIDQLYADLSDAVGPSRLLDCRLHEVLTGQLNQCKEADTKASNEQHGEMLLEGGGELKWQPVDQYTWDVRLAARLLPPDTAYALSYMPAGHRIYRTLPETKPFSAFIRDQNLDPVMGETSKWGHAHAMCKLALAWRMKK